MDYWLWIDKIPGPPSNNDWFELLGYSIGSHSPGGAGGRLARFTEFSAMVPHNSSAAGIFRASATATPIEKCVIFNEPQTEYHFSKCLITSVNISNATGGAVMTLTVNFEKFEIKKRGGP